MRYSGLILLTILRAGPMESVPGEVCRLLGSGDWGPVDTYSGSVGGCLDLGPDDTVIVDAEAVVRTVDDILMDGVSPGATIRVEGTWIVDSADRSGGPGPIRIALNGNQATGVVSFGSASVTILGRVLEWGVDHASGARYLESPSTAPGTYPSVESAVLCPDASGLEDCSEPTRREILRIFPTPEPFRSDYLARVTTGHRLCFFTPDDRLLSPPAQAGFCFEIVGVGANHLDLDVRRSGGVDEFSYPDALRSHAVTRLASPVASGERCFLVEDLIAAEGERVGQWIHFETASGDLDPDALLLSATDDDVLPAVDRLCVADAAGVLGPHAAAERAWLAWGIEPGDPFYVDAPIVFESATSEACDSVTRLGGTLSLRGASFRGLASVAIGDGIPATLVACERLRTCAKRNPRGSEILWEGTSTT